MSTKIASENNTETDSKKDNQSIDVEINMNSNIQPIFSDNIFKFEIDTETRIAKLFFGQVMDEKIFHNSTAVIPLQTLLRLKKLLNSEQFETDTKVFEQR